MSIDFTAVDFSTGNKQICAIGAVRVRNGEIVDTFYQEVNPEVGEFRPNDTKINGGYTEQSVEKAPLFPDVYSDFLDFIGEDELVGVFKPNSPMKILERALDRYDLEKPQNVWFDLSNFFDCVHPEHLTSYTYADRGSGLLGIARWALDITKLDTQNNPEKDAELMARSTVVFCKDIGGYSLRDANAKVCREREAEDRKKHASMISYEEYSSGVNGAELKAFRLDLGLSIEQASDVTRLKASEIEEMESKDMLTSGKAEVYLSFLARYREMQNTLFVDRMQKLSEAMKKYGAGEGYFKVALYRDQKHYDTCNPPEKLFSRQLVGVPLVPYEMFNQTSLQVKLVAEISDIPITFVYPKGPSSKVY